MSSKCDCCIISGSDDFDLHHVKTRKSGGCDSSFNLMPIKRVYHVEVHKIGNNRFVEKYPQVKKWLIKNGWEFDNFLRKWKRFKNE